MFILSQAAKSLGRLIDSYTYKGVSQLKERIHRNTPPHGLYWEQIRNKKTGKWEDITLSHITKIGAKLTLKRWCKKQYMDEDIEI